MDGVLPSRQPFFNDMYILCKNRNHNYASELGSAIAPCGANIRPSLEYKFISNQSLIESITFLIFHKKTKKEN